MSDAEREEACAAAPVPTTMSAELDGYEWARDTVGESDGAVCRLHGKAYAPNLFLKHGRDAVADDITDEMVRLHWLADHMPVPMVAHFVRTPDEAWLLMTATRGERLIRCWNQVPTLVPVSLMRW